jgi:hypothetical protein
MCTVLADNSRRGRKRVGNRRRGKRCAHPELRGRGGIYAEIADAGRNARKGGAQCRVQAEGADWVVRCGGIPRIVYMDQMVKGARAACLACLGGWSMHARGEENE